MTSRILLTGATGYIGGRLLKALEATGRPLRCLARRPDALRAKAADTTEIVAGDLQDAQALAAALNGVHTAYYLVHSMGDAIEFEERERASAAHFAAAAEAAGIQRIVYLGGLGDDANALSPHLRSRQDVGRILRGGRVPTLEFRASIVIGSGSLSFELVRALTEHLPVMITPRWVRTLSQPIAVEDVIAYLMASLDSKTSESRVFEIGGCALRPRHRASPPRGRLQ